MQQLLDRDTCTYNEFEIDQNKQVAKEVTQTVRAIYQEGHIGKAIDEYLLPLPMVRTQEMYSLKET